MITTIIWMLLAILGIITGIWYFKSTIFNPYGRANYPALLWVWGPVGHLISWALIILSIIAVAMLIKLLAIKTIFLILGVVLLAFSMWGWIGFVLVVKKRISFATATPCQFLALTLIAFGLIFYDWRIAVFGIAFAGLLYEYLTFITKRRHYGDVRSWTAYLTDYLCGQLRYIKKACLILGAIYIIFLKDINIGISFLIAGAIIWFIDSRVKRKEKNRDNLSMDSVASVKCPFCKKRLHYLGDSTKPYACGCGAYGEWEIEGKVLRFSKGNRSERLTIARGRRSGKISKFPDWYLLLRPELRPTGERIDKLEALRAKYEIPSEVFATGISSYPGAARILQINLYKQAREKWPDMSEKDLLKSVFIGRALKTEPYGYGMTSEEFEKVMKKINSLDELCDYVVSKDLKEPKYEFDLSKWEKEVTMLKNTGIGKEIDWKRYKRYKRNAEEMKRDNIKASIYTIMEKEAEIAMAKEKRGKTEDKCEK